MLTAARAAPFKVCGCCKATYDQAGWERLPYVGVMKTEDEKKRYVLELRNCPCNSTLGVERSTPKFNPKH